MNKILVIAGPSAVGKTTVMNEILRTNEGFEYIRSATTRAPRGDAFDSEYIYLSENEFKERIANGGMLEYTEYGENFYGTPKSEIERIFSAGKTPLLILDLNGVQSLKSSPYEFGVFAVYITGDRKLIEERLFERMKAAGSTPNANEIYEKRKAQNLADSNRYNTISHLFDLTVENGEVTECAKRIVSAFNSPAK